MSPIGFSGNGAVILKEKLIGSSTHLNTDPKTAFKKGKFEALLG